VAPTVSLLQDIAIIDISSKHLITIINTKRHPNADNILIDMRL
jgi:hypothetical protein